MKNVLLVQSHALLWVLTGRFRMLIRHNRHPFSISKDNGICHYKNTALDKSGFRTHHESNTDFSENLPFKQQMKENKVRTILEMEAY